MTPSVATREAERERGPEDDQQLRGEDGPVGRLDPGKDVECYHGRVTFPTDPDPVFLAHCDLDAVFKVPMRDVFGLLPLCPFHLARYVDAFDDLGAEAVARGARQHAAEPAFVSIDDAPKSIDALNRVWYRAAIDQRGIAHYHRPSDDIIVTLAPTFEVESIEQIGDVGFPGHMERVRKDVGWAAFDPELRIPTGGSE